MNQQNIDTGTHRAIDEKVNNKQGTNKQERMSNCEVIVTTNHSILIVMNVFR